MFRKIISKNLAGFQNLAGLAPDIFLEYYIYNGIKNRQDWKA
jgi:hypothetical protein